MINQHSLVEKLREAEQILALQYGLSCQNAEYNKAAIIRGLARLKSVVTDAELLLGVQPKNEIAPPLQQAAVSGSLELLAQLLNREQQAAAELGGYAVKTGKVKNIESIQMVMKLISELSANDR